MADVVRTAYENRLTLYPVSRGLNWGLGSRVPTADDCFILDLGELKKLEYDSEQGTITVEPGVSFAEVSEHLEKLSSPHFISVIGGPPQASLIGNLVERGDGLGLMGERANHSCNLKIVSGLGETFRTGFGSFQHSRLKNLSKWGVGPSLDGIFTQSNLGIITEATFWLQEKPRHFQSLVFTLKKENAIQNAFPTIKQLINQGVLSPFSIGIWNSYKYAATMARHPKPGENENININELLQATNPKLKDVEWFGVGAIYSGTDAIGKAKKKAVKKQLNQYCQQLLFVDQKTSRRIRRGNKFFSFFGKEILDEDTLDSLFKNSVFQGNPTMKSVRSIYWRKPGDIPMDANADRDKCGIHWMCHAVPFAKTDISRATEIVKDILLSKGLEPNIAFLPASPRHLHLCVAIIYDREVKLADEIALACHDSVFSQLTKSGYSPYRLGIQSMKWLEESDRLGKDIYKRLKGLFDPNNVIAPGRY